MLSLAKAAKDYYLRKLGEISPREDYYLRGGTATGRWVGQGAADLGLEATVSAEELVRLFDGQHPATGEHLGRRLCRDRVAAWDLTFSADKSVSLLWALGDDETRRQVLEGFGEATSQALSYLESVASSTRGARRVPILDAQGCPVLNDDGTPRYRTETWSIPTPGYVAVSFTEFTSRADDPQLHTHVVVGNRVKGTDGVWRALDGRQLYRHQLAAGYLHEAVLRRELTVRLGVRWQQVERGMADIEGFTRDQVEAFSRRRQELEAWREEQGLAASPAAREVATLATRSPKADHPLETLLPGWQERARDVGLTPERITRILHRGREVTNPDPERLFGRLVSPAGLSCQVSTFGRAEVIQEVAASLPEGGTRAEIEALTDAFLRHQEVIPLLAAPQQNSAREVTPEERSLALDTGDGFMRRRDRTLFPAREEPRYSTAELLQTEQRIIDRALQGVGTGRWRASERQVEQALRQYRHLTLGQREMVRAFVLSGNAVEVGVGPAGSGKTAVMAVIRELALRTGTTIYGAALAARAAAGLQAVTEISSSTLTRFLGQAREGGLAPGAIVVVDEAGMVGTRTLAQVSDRVEEARGKLILLGDHRQLPELEAGGLFRALAHRLPAVELTDNVRQHQPWERQALAELREGSVELAVALYQRRDRIRLSSTPEETLSRAVRDWYREVEATGELEGTLLLSQRNQTVDELNQKARELMAASGRLRGRSLWAGQQDFRAGDRVLCRKNRPGLGVLNGDLGTVVTVDRKRKTLTIRLDRDGESHTLPTSYVSDNLTYGYALTGHRAQGVTVRKAFNLVEGNTDREWTYVTMSRGRQANTLYLTRPDPEKQCTHLAHRGLDPHHALAASVQRSSAQLAALDTGAPGHQVTTTAGPGPRRSDLAARLDWFITRRLAAREVEQERQKEQAGLEREATSVGIGR
ncbi:MAG: MobF family relaxase [Acidimicrobiia bacterium]